MKPLVTIITANYNNELYIKATAESILAQTYSNWEWIVVDDGSTDKSPQILENYAKNNNRINFYRRDRAPKGPSTCRNIGIEKAKGEFVIFLDGDDLLAEFCLEQRVSFLLESNKLDFAVFKMEPFWDKIEERTQKTKRSNKNHFDNLSMFIQNKYPWTITSPIWKIELLREIKGFDEKLLRTTDPDIHVRALLYPNVKYNVLEDVKIDCFYRQRESHKNSQWLYNVIHSRVIYQKKIFAVLEQRNQNTQVSNIIKNSLIIGILELLKNWILIRIVDFNEVFYSHLTWAHKHSLISKKNFFLLRVLAKLWENKNWYWAKNLHIKGILYKLIR